MIVLFWCPTCRALHSPSEVAFADDASATMVEPRCVRSGEPVEFRGIPDDPDDERYGLPRCPVCRADVQASSRFCPRCGAPLYTGPLTLPSSPPPPNPEVLPAGGEDGTPAVYRNTAQMVVQFARQRMHRQQVAAILELLADPPATRRQPQSGDLPGDFDAWFDGGAVRYLTSITEYHFADGSHASFHDLSLTKLNIVLPDDAQVTVEEPPVQSSFADQVLAAVVGECQQILQSLQGEGILPPTGRPPTQCMIVEKTTSSSRQAWLYDLGTNRLTPYPIDSLDMSREPTDGMYFQRGLVQYRVADDRRTLQFSSTLGPRFGRGLIFDLIEEPTGVQLANPRMLWMA